MSEFIKMNETYSKQLNERFLCRQAKEEVLPWHERYIHKKQELDKYFESLIAPYIEGQKLKILDACCGAGHITYILNQIAPQSEFLGVDLLDFLVEKAEQLCEGHDNVAFKVMDVYSLSENFDKKFDICINWKTLSWLEYYETALRELVKVTKKHIFISSLFYDGNIDFETKVNEYLNNSDIASHSTYYNIYSYPKFERFCYSLGARNVEAYDFEIGIDLPKPNPDEMKTYTVKQENGKRLQISGAVLMPWKIVRIDI